MGITRKRLREMGLAKELQDALLAAHMESVLALRARADAAEAQLQEARAQREAEEKARAAEVTGVPVATPPEVCPNITREDVLAIRDTAERQRAIARNHQLFGF